MKHGYWGRLLWVDLSNGHLSDEILDEKVARDYLGGYGLGARVLFDTQPGGVDPLGPDNTLGFLTGALTGTPALGGSRFAVVGKSPLTGTWGDSNCGGKFGPFLRFAGYDAVFLTGIADSPVYLSIVDGVAEIKNASHLWGRDTHETEDLLKEEFGSRAQVACIGPAGEKLALIAGIITDKGRAAARSGLGAVMGSKKLKAIVVSGSGEVPLHDATGLALLRRDTARNLGGFIDAMRSGGTVEVVVPFGRIGDTPVKNWSGSVALDFPGLEKVGRDPIMERVRRKYSCHGCVVGCGGLMKENNGTYKYGSETHKPEYETVGVFGPNCLNDDVESIIKANDLCNRYGLDTISAGSCIAFAMECYEKGLITKRDTGGIELNWGNHASMIASLELIGTRTGLGDVLADGVKIAAERIGRGAEDCAVHIHGQEPPAHHPVLEYGFASCYRMDATPARHCRWHDAFVPPGVPIPEYEPGSWKGRGRAQKMNMVLNHSLESLGLCLIAVATYPHVDSLLQFLRGVTGWDVTLDELLLTGERIANLRQVFNLREGLNQLEYQISGRLEGKPPLLTGPLAGATIDQEAVNSEFLQAMDWDAKTAKPSRRKLMELGLDDLVAYAS